VIAHADRIGNRGQRRVHRPDADEETRVHDVEIVERHVLGRGLGLEPAAPCVVRSVIVLTDFAITDVTTAHVTERNEPPPVLVRKHEAHSEGFGGV
jgi:hypothetical protein